MVVNSNDSGCSNVLQTHGQRLSQTTRGQTAGAIGTPILCSHQILLMSILLKEAQCQPGDIKVPFVQLASDL
jgi:hypothetical protein